MAVQEGSSRGLAPGTQGVAQQEYSAKGMIGQRKHGQAQEDEDSAPGHMHREVHQQ